jgi:hypothetical protein
VAGTRETEGQGFRLGLSIEHPGHVWPICGYFALGWRAKSTLNAPCDARNNKLWVSLGYPQGRLIRQKSSPNRSSRVDRHGCRRGCLRHSHRGALSETIRPLVSARSSYSSVQARSARTSTLSRRSTRTSGPIPKPPQHSLRTNDPPTRTARRRSRGSSGTSRTRSRATTTACPPNGSSPTSTSTSVATTTAQMAGRLVERRRARRRSYRH